MDSQRFSDLENDVHKEKSELDKNLSILLSQSPDYTKEILNSTHIQGTKFFSKFESFLTSVTSEHEALSKTQIQDILTSIENVLEFSIEYWDVMIEVSKNILGQPYCPERNFMKTSQSILKTYRKDKASELNNRFKLNNIPTTGFNSKEKYKLTSIKIDWVSLVVGMLLLIISGLIVFILDINTGMKYFFSRVLISLSIALVFTGVAKDKIQAKMNVPGMAITAAGTIAIFLVLYFANPAEMPKISQDISGQPHNKKIQLTV